MYGNVFCEVYTMSDFHKVWSNQTGLSQEISSETNIVFGHWSGIVRPFPEMVGRGPVLKFWTDMTRQPTEQTCRDTITGPTFSCLCQDCATVLVGQAAALPGK